MVDRSLLKSLKNRRVLLPVILLLSVGVLFMTLSSLPKEEEYKGTDISKYKTELEEELEALLSSVEGVGRCKVTVTVGKGEERVYKNGILIEVIPPTISGVTVVCRGADSDTVRFEVTEMITALFGIGYNRVAVVKLN